MTDTQPDPEAKALAGRMRTAREVRYMPQEAVAAALGISRSGVSDIERGTRQVSALELRRAAELFKVAPDVLLYGIGERKTVPAWTDDAVYEAGAWHDLETPLAALVTENRAYERDGREVLDIAGPDGTTAGALNLGVWLLADDMMNSGLPMFEITLAAGALHLRVFAGAHRDLLGLLRELSPIVKDLHLAQLAAELGAVGRTVEAAEAILKAAGE